MFGGSGISHASEQRAEGDSRESVYAWQNDLQHLRHFISEFSVSDQSSIHSLVVNTVVYR